MKWYWSKYPIWVKNLVVILAVILGGLWSFYEIWKSGEKAAKIAQTTSEVLKIKGFYLGMNIDEAAELLNAKYITREKIEDGTFKPASKTIMGEDGQIKEIKKFKKVTVEQMENGMIEIIINKESEGLDAIYSMATGGLIGGPQCMVSIKAGTDKKVTEIFFDTNMTDFLFNSKDMDCETFTEEFAKAYNISNFEPFIKEEKVLQFDPYTNTSEIVPVYKNYYRCSSNKGYYIEISEEKNLLIKSIPKSTERSFD